MSTTARGSYSCTPHKTIHELRAMYLDRIAHGEPAWFVLQDIVNGYDLGWQSANHRYIETGIR